jgi:hypothetical protein
MRRLTLSITLMVLPCAFGEDKPDAKGVKITTKDGKVSIVFPSKPKTRKVDGIEVSVVEIMNGQRGYMLSYGDLPFEIDLTDKPLVEKAFGVARRDVIRSVEGKLVSKKDIKLGAFPGHTYDAEMSEGIYRVRLFLTGKRFVQILVFGPKEFVDSAEAKKFLESLKIEAAKGVKITTKDGKASAVFPAQPTKLKHDTIVLYNLRDKDKKTSFLLMETDMVNEVDLADKASVEKTFEEARDATLRVIKGKLLSEKHVKFGKLPGYTFDAELPDGFYRSRMYMKRKSCIGVVVGGSKAFVDGPEAKKFLDSLKIEAEEEKIEAEVKEAKITTKDGKVSVVFPGRPRKRTAGTAERYVLERIGGKSGFVFNRNDLPEGLDLTNEAVITKAFENARDAILRKSKGKLLGSKEIKLGKLPGYTFDSDIEGTVCRVRIYFVESSFVQVNVIGSKEFVEGPEAKKFLDSLKIEK